MQLTRGFVPSKPPPAEPSTSPEAKHSQAPRRSSEGTHAPRQPARDLGALLAGSAMLAVPVLAAFLAIRALAPPSPLPADAPPTEFSAVRAAALLTDIATAPHALGMAAHDAVRDVLLRDWRGLGLEPIVQSGTWVGAQEHYAARVENILVRLPGTQAAPGRALLIATHYDSAETGPGAADDGSGVATLLETARALLAGPRPARDTIFLVTDAEEDGMIGAHVFCDQHPWTKDVGLVLNFEARGTTGPSLIFETSAGNARLIDALAATPHPRGYSISQTVYRRMPNDTDLTVFMKGGLQGMNFAFIGHPLDYHTPNDNLAHLDLGGLQQDGSYAVALARRFGGTGIPERAAADEVFFSLFGDILVHYSSRMALLIAGLAAALVIGAIVAAGVGGTVRAGGLLRGVAFFAASLAAAAGLGYGFLAAVSASHGRWLPAGPFSSDSFYPLALVFLGVAAAVLIFGLVRKRATGLEAACGAGIVWAGLAVEAAIALPDASYLVGVPALLLASVVFLWGLRRDRASRGGMFERDRGLGSGANHNESREPESEPGIVPALVAAGFVALIAAPAINLMFVTMSLSPLIAAVISAGAAWMTTAATPAVAIVRRRLGKSLAATLILAFVVCAVAGALTSRYTDRDPRWVSLSYLVDSDKGQAYWVTRGRDAGPWLKEIAGGDFKTGQPQPEFAGRPDAFAYRGAPLPSGSEGAPPEVRVEEDGIGGVIKAGESRPSGGMRVLRMRISSPRGGRHFVVQCTGEGIVSAVLEGRPLVLGTQNAKGFSFAFMNPGPKGFDLTVTAGAAAPIVVKVRESDPGFPALSGVTVPALPPALGLLRSETVRFKTFVFAQADASR